LRLIFEENAGLKRVTEKFLFPGDMESKDKSYLIP
jgi:hypothetical protein